MMTVFSEKFAMLLDEPVLLQANMWYVAWARISGPSSDCGSNGQTVITTDEQYVAYTSITGLSLGLFSS